MSARWRWFVVAAVLALAVTQGPHWLGGRADRAAFGLDPSEADHAQYLGLLVAELADSEVMLGRIARLEGAGSTAASLRGDVRVDAEVNGIRVVATSKVDALTLAAAAARAYQDVLSPPRATAEGTVADSLPNAVALAVIDGDIEQRRLPAELTEQASGLRGALATPTTAAPTAAISLVTPSPIDDLGPVAPPWRRSVLAVTAALVAAGAAAWWCARRTARILAAQEEFEEPLDEHLAADPSSAGPDLLLVDDGCPAPLAARANPDIDRTEGPTPTSPEMSSTLRIVDDSCPGPLGAPLHTAVQRPALELVDDRCPVPLRLPEDTPVVPDVAAVAPTVLAPMFGPIPDGLDDLADEQPVQAPSPASRPATVPETQNTTPIGSAALVPSWIGALPFEDPEHLVDDATEAFDRERVENERPAWGMANIAPVWAGAVPVGYDAPELSAAESSQPAIRHAGPAWGVATIAAMWSGPPPADDRTRTTAIEPVTRVVQPLGLGSIAAVWSGPPPIDAPAPDPAPSRAPAPRPANDPRVLRARAPQHRPAPAGTPPIIGIGETDVTAPRLDDAALDIIEQRAAGSRLLVLSAAQPPSPSSVLALSLARSLAERRERCVLVDADFSESTVDPIELTDEFGVTGDPRARRSLAALLDEPGRTLLAPYFSHRTSGLTYLPAGSTPRHEAALAQRSLSQVIDELRRSDTYVVMWCPPMATSPAAGWIAAANDGVVVPVLDPDSSSLGALRALADPPAAVLAVQQVRPRVIDVRSPREPALV